MIEIVMFLLTSMVVATIACMLGKHYGVSYLVAMFTGSYVVANAIAPKIITLGPITTTASVAVYSVTFLLTDCISEFYGKSHAKKAVWSGFLGLLLFIFITQNTIALAPASFWADQASFVRIFGTTTRIAIASLVAYFVSQTHDVWAYHFWKEKTNGKHLWLRNNASTWVSQTLSSTIFVTIGFSGVAPLWPLIWGSIVIKIAIALLDTPFIYAVRAYYRWNPKVIQSPARV